MKPGRLGHWIVCLALPGCTSLPPAPSITIPAEFTDSKIENLAEKSYEISKRASAYVGQPIISVKAYTIATTTNSVITSYRPDKDFSVWYEAADAPVHKPIFSALRGTDIPVRGFVTLQGVQFRVIENWSHDRCLGDQGWCGFYVSPKGEILTTRSRVTTNSSTMDSQLKLKVVPPDVVLKERMETASREERQSGARSEIIYSGRTDTQINLLYREYTKEDLARPAFFQSLTYSANEKFVRFKNFRILILNATNEEIQYSVVEE